MEKPLGLHCIALGQMQTNCYIVINRDTKEAVVFDPGDQGDKIMDTLKKEGVSLAAVCLTHAHFDHIMGLPYLMEVNDKLPVYLHEAEQDVLLNPQLNLSNMVGLTISLQADRIVKDGDEIELLGAKVTCIHVPGHTKGGVCYYFSEYGWLISGDTLFQQSIGRTDFPTGDLNALLTGIRSKLFVLPPETKVFSGHTPPTTIGEEIRSNPFLM